MMLGQAVLPLAVSAYLGGFTWMTRRAFQEGRERALAVFSGILWPLILGGRGAQVLLFEGVTQAKPACSHDDEPWEGIGHPVRKWRCEGCRKIVPRDHPRNRNREEDLVRLQAALKAERELADQARQAAGKTLLMLKLKGLTPPRGWIGNTEGEARASEHWAHGCAGRSSQPDGSWPGWYCPCWQLGSAGTLPEQVRRIELAGRVRPDWEDCSTCSPCDGNRGL